MPRALDIMSNVSIALTGLHCPDKEKAESLDIARDIARDFLASEHDATMRALLDTHDADTLFRVLSLDLNIPHLAEQGYRAACEILSQRDALETDRVEPAVATVSA